MTDFRLFSQVTDGHLRLVPLGELSSNGVKQLLGASQAGLQAFPVVVVDLQETRNATSEMLDRLEAGLRQLVADKKLILGLEPQRWTLQKMPHQACQCQGNCRNCPNRHHQEQKPEKESESA